ncbi:hypothetical protein C8Q80DRAFT_1264775 [Daedaleopsis nitida]|nr:hypothetical protein C8Q80DRAFT_1264775 [Daedaleopsis nitida]
MSSAAKLTKKQKKALAFRERKGKSKSSAQTFDEMDNDVPVDENQDLAEAELDAEAVPVEAPTRPAAAAKKGDTQDADALGGSHKSKKRKREVEDEGTQDGGKRLDEDKEAGVDGSASKPKEKKKRKDMDGAGVEVEGGQTTEKAGSEGKQRFILFVGNLKYTTSKEAVEKHFAKCDPPPTVRLMTPKPSAKSRPTAKSKGFAFVEFTHTNALQQGLKLHQTELEGRKINVELTAGGGGKSEARLEKVKKRNRDLHEQRKTHLTKRSSAKKNKGEGDDGDYEDAQIERPQRYSATSGVEQMPLKRRTWSIPDAADEGTSGKKKRGSKKGKQRPPKPLGTGVNAIPVG